MMHTKFWTEPKNSLELSLSSIRGCFFITDGRKAVAFQPKQENKPKFTLTPNWCINTLIFQTNAIDRKKPPNLPAY